jgi:glycine hydroxymethyltransferase
MTVTEQMQRPLAEVDPQIFEAIQHEVERQHSQIELIASENFTSQAVLDATGSVFTNKYAEGYPGKRYYGGCEFTDVVENLARERAKQLFHAEYANVQPHSGSQANQAAYAAVLSPGDTVMGLNLAHGGHLTHGHPLNFSGKTYHIVPYGVRKDDERIDYDELQAAGRRAQAEDDCRRRQRLSAHARFRALPPGGRFRGRHFPGGHGAHFRPGGRGRASQSLRVCRYRDLDHAQDPARTARGIILAKEKYGAAIDKTVFPGMQGGPLVHVIAAKAVCFLEAMQPGFVDYQKQVWPTRRRWRRA